MRIQVIQAGLGDTALFSVTSSCHNCQLSTQHASASLPFLKVFAFFWGGAVFPDPLDLAFGVAGAGPAERKERTVAGMLRAEKKKVELPLGLSRHVC